MSEVQKAPGWERIRVQIDSRTIDTVALRNFAKLLELKQLTTSKNDIGFIAPNGSQTCYGERNICGIPTTEKES